MFVCLKVCYVLYLYVCVSVCVFSKGVLHACVCVTQGWLTNHLEARCRLENYSLSSLPACLQLLLVPLVNPWTLTSTPWNRCVCVCVNVCLPHRVNGEVVTFLKSRELSLCDLWSSSSLIGLVPILRESIFFTLSFSCLNFLPPHAVIKSRENVSQTFFFLRLIKTLPKLHFLYFIHLIYKTHVI